MDSLFTDDQLAPFVRQWRRDAYAVVRGFLYQIQRTVMAWLDLDDRTVLFCECGEDIDYLRRSFDQEGGRVSIERVLEQVKYRGTTSVTLRSREIVESLGNFIASRNANPDHFVTYRFFTNANSGAERGFTFPSGLTGIEAWRAVRAGSLNSLQIQQAIRLIRRILYDTAAQYRDAVPPLRHSKEILELLSSADDHTLMTDVILPIEWAVGNPDIHNMRAELDGKVLALGYSGSPTEAQELGGRLVLHVLYLVGSPGEKRLDKTCLLRVLREGTAGEADNGRLTAIYGFLREYKEKIEYIAQGVASLQEGQAQIKAQIKEGLGAFSLSLGSGLGPTPALETRPALDTPPMPAAILAHREALVRQIEEQLQRSVCVTLVGSSGMGKTQLARSVWDRRQRVNMIWISLKGESSLLHHHLDQQLLCWYTQLIGDDRVWQDYATGEVSGSELALAVATLAGSGAFVVIDDLPEQLGKTLLVERLATLARSLKDVDGRMLITSQHPLSISIRDVLGAIAGDIPVPAMETADVTELLEVARAPRHVATEKVASLIAGLTKGHPFLVAITVSWLERNQWDLAGETFSALLAGEPWSQAKDETRRRARAMVQDGNTRDLLDRLSLLGLPFDLDMLWSVAAVEEPIPRAKERLDELIGPWIQRLSGSLFEVSPLVQDAGNTYLPPRLQRQVHRAIGRQYLGMKSVPAEHAIQTSIHLFKAEDWHALASFLIQLFSAVRTPEQAKSLGLMRFYFRPESKWPAALIPTERILVRASQVRLTLLAGESESGFEADLEKLIAKATSEESLAVFLARTQTGPLLEQVGPEATALRAIQASRAYRQVEGQLPEQLPLAPEIFFWAAVGKLTDLEQVQGLTRVLRSLTDGERRIVFTTNPGPQMAMFLADACYSFAAENEPANSDWNKALGLLDELEQIGSLEGSEPLLVAARRARAIVLADYLQKTDDALEMLEQTRDGLGNSSAFLLYFTRACILLAKNRADEAFRCFQDTLAFNAAEDYPFLFCDAFRRGMQAAVHTGHWEEARKWCRSGMALAIAGEGSDGYEYLEFIGELAWIHWCMGHRRKAFAAMHGLIRSLLGLERRDDPRYVETFIKAGHVLTWLASSAAAGSPPSVTISGEEYATPFSGIFCTRRPAISELNSPLRVPALLYQLGRMAMGVGCNQLAKSTYSLAIRGARAEGLIALSCHINLELAAIDGYLGDFVEAAAAAVEGMQVLANSPGVEDRESIVDSTEDPGTAWLDLDPGRRSDIENFALFYGVVFPSFIGILDRCQSHALRLQSLGHLETGLAAVGERLTRLADWNRLIGYVKSAFVPDGNRARILSDIRSLAPDQTHERIVLYLGLACVGDATPADSANALAVVLIYLADMKALADPLRGPFSRWVIRFWRHQAAERGFRLSSPVLLRQTLVKVPDSTVAPSDAASVLLAAAVPASASFERSVRERLFQISQSP